jgi:glutathione synthase/RimK-type ligase-like ATP-grasp enzyme
VKNLLILIDYNKDFLISLNSENKYVSMDVRKIEQIFTSKGFKVEVLEFSELDYSRNYKGYYILYQTSEAKGQYYKKYIEDVVYYLQMSGAIVLPEYKYLKAHHNKGFSELLRNKFSDESLKTIKSKYYGNPIEALKENPELPVVIKQISGAGSAGIYCANTMKDYKKYVEKVSKTMIEDSYCSLYINIFKSIIKRFLSLVNPKYRTSKSTEVYRPFIVQNLIEGLPGDYKVLYFGGKYYTLFRKNRKNDFRASGSGLFYDVPLEENIALLNFAEKVVKEIDFPIIGMDIGFDGNRFHLIEFQTIHLGPYTLQKANYYFLRKNDKWECVSEKSNLEEEFSRSIYEYIESKYSNSNA